MQHHQIEAWALRVIERVLARQPLEDARVELKAEWPTDHAKAARRIAGHANAARGAPILWLVGVDEVRGLVGAEPNDLATWWPQVRRNFEGIMPALVDLNLSHSGHALAALFFETTRAPFVVRNPVSGPVEYEVPWREGTAVRSARRDELLQILSPLQMLPTVEVMSAELKVHRTAPGTLSWGLLMRLYFVPSGDQPFVIPFHRCNGTAEVLGGMSPVVFDDIVIGPPREPTEEQRRPLSLTIDATNNEVIVRGAGKVMLNARASSSNAPTRFNQPAIVTVELRPAGVDQPVVISQTLDWQVTEAEAPPGTARWVWSIPRYADLVQRQR